ncbi:hemagglutinin repeat-containing protein [Thorsellia kenyensis]|uniref:Hemagglutinin repeat-containing protein n=1 Tax=Thorsellia kenyensis TaxID=1549888 RepID=A0ABV6CBU3_9GAMM
MPQVYAKVQPSDLDSSGALLSAKNMQLELKGDFTNTGSLQAKETLIVNAGTINNHAGQLQANQIGLTATQDINNVGGSILADDALIARAGGDINVITTTKNNHSINPSDGKESTVINQVAQMGVMGDEGVLVLEAGNNLTLTAANLVNQGEESSTLLKAGNDITLNTVQTQSKDHVGSGDNYWHQESSSEVGTQIYGAGDISLIAGNDMDSIAASVTADKNLTVQAGNNITLREGISTETLDSQTKTSSKGLFSSSSTTTRTQIDNQTSTGSEFNGDTITMVAGNDALIQGSDVIADETLTLKAGNDVNITTAKEQYYTQTTTERKKSGVMSGGGLGVFVGKKSDKTDDSYRDGVEVGSTLGSLNNNVNIVAGNNANIHGSDLIAGEDINVVAKDISITAAANTHDETHITESKSSGLTVSLGGSVGGAINSAVGSASQTSRSNSDRKNALLGLSSALSGAQGLQELRLANASNQPNPYGSTLGINASYGSQSSRSEETLNEVNHSGSHLSAGGDINLQATEKDIRIEGSRLDAENNITLEANRDVLLQAAQDTSKLEGKNESRGWSLGGSIDLAGTIGLNASANRGKGNENGHSLTHQNTLITAGNDVSITSNRDTLIQGGQVNGDGITVDVGRDLRIESLQDSESYESKQTNLGANVGVSFGTNTSVSGGINGDRIKMDSDYASVQEQSGLFAGNKGVDINVENNTHLKGGVIASKGEDNSLSTGTLSFEDIENKAQFDVSSNSVGGNLGMGGLSIPGVSNSNNSGESDSTTQATIGNNIDITLKDETNQTQDIDTLNRDTDNAHQSLDKIFDKDKEQERLDEEKLISDIGNQLSNIVRTEGQIRAEKAKNDPAALELAKKELLAEGKNPSTQDIEQRAQNNAMRDWGTGGKYQQVTQALTGALKGALGGDITKALANGSAPYLAEGIKNATTNPDGSVNTEANLAAHAILGALLSAANDNNALAGGLGALSAEAAANLIKNELYGDKSFADLTEDERQNISALSQIAAAVAGGLTGDSASDATQGAIIGKNAIENNYLNTDEKHAKTMLEFREQEGILSEKDQLRLLELRIKDESSTEALLLACQDVNSKTCEVERKKAYNDLATYKHLTYHYPPEKQVGYQEIQSLLDATSKEADFLRLVYDSYKRGYEDFGFNEKQAGAMAGRTIAVQFMVHGVSGGVSLSRLGQVFGNVKVGGSLTPKQHSKKVDIRNSDATNVANYQKLKDDLYKQNLDNIAKQDLRLDAAVKGGNGKVNFGIGVGTTAEADRLGKIWVGDGAKRTSDGGWISADGTRGYRPPSSKDSSFATTGVQANFETYNINDKGNRVKISNGHLNIKD